MRSAPQEMHPHERPTRPCGGFCPSGDQDSLPAARRAHGGHRGSVLPLLEPSTIPDHRAGRCHNAPCPKPPGGTVPAPDLPPGVITYDRSNQDWSKTDHFAHLASLELAGRKIFDRGLTQLFKSDKWRKALKSARKCVLKSDQEPILFSPHRCEPQIWHWKACKNGCFCTATPQDRCGRIDCLTCQWALTRRRARSAQSHRYANCDMFLVVATYPIKPMPGPFRAMSRVVAPMVAAWLRSANSLPESCELAYEDQRHPSVGNHDLAQGLTAEVADTDRPTWHPHHNILGRLDAVLPGGKRIPLRRWYGKQELLALRLIWQVILGMFYGSLRSATNIHYSYAPAERPHQIAHKLRYTVRTFPGWAKSAGRRVAFGRFRRKRPADRDDHDSSIDTDRCSCCGGQVWELGNLSRQEVAQLLSVAKKDPELAIRIANRNVPF
jgi:hypothetical protein